MSSFRHQNYCHTLCAPPRQDRWETTGLRIFIRPPHLVQPEASLDPLEGNTPTVGEDEAFADDELTDDIGDHNLTRLGTSTDAEGRVDGRAEQAPLRGDRLARVDADAYVDGAVGVLLVVPGEGPLDEDRAVHRADSGGEGRLDAVTGVRNLKAVVGPQGIADETVVGA